jgi:glutathione S-transferase
MITIYGVPISVHVRKPIVAAILKKIDYKVDPVVPFNPPPDWTSLSPTGLIPAMKDADYALSESSAICLYLERKQAAPSILPAGDKEYARAMFWDDYAGWVFRSLVQGLFFQKVITPAILKGTTDQTVIDNLLTQVRPKIFGYLESEIDGTFLVGSALSLADIAIVSNLINYQYLGFAIEAEKYPKLKKYNDGILCLDAFQRALAVEAPVAQQFGLDRQFLN